ncbi:glycosyl hydrolase, partial [Bacillus haynesii]|nr:glycosyl hydrolase [Bacillus haynesii]
IRKQAVGSEQPGLNAGDPATCFPTAATIANSWNKDLAEKMGEYLGKEAVTKNVNVLLGPGINIKRNPLCGRNFEYFSEDPYLAGKLAAGMIKGIQSQGISACVKHLAVNNQEERRMTIDAIVDERTLREIYLTAFEIAVKEGKAKSIMTSYNRLNGTYTNEHLHLMQDILRSEWDFKGVVVTDWGGSNDRIAGLLAGNELEMPTTAG